MTKRIKNIIFDIGGVVVLQPNLHIFLSTKLSKNEAPLLEQAIRDCFEKKSRSKDFNEKVYWNTAYKYITSWENYNLILREYFASEKVNTELVNEIYKIKNRGQMIFALTNNTKALTKILKKYNLQNLFDGVYNSAYLGYVKPDPEIFDYVLRDIGSEPQECIFIDDNEKNTSVARDLGMHSITFTGNHRLLNILASYDLRC